MGPDDLCFQLFEISRCLVEYFCWTECDYRCGVGVLIVVKKFFWAVVDVTI